MLNFSTDLLPARDRFEYWREAVISRVFGIQGELKQEHVYDFTGRIFGSKIGSATLIKAQASPYLMRRSLRTVDPAPEGDLCIWKIVHGGGLIVSGATTQRFEPGTTSTRFDDAPGFFQPDPEMMRPDGIGSSWNINIPAKIVSELPGQASSNVALPHMATTGIDVLLRSYLTTFIEQASQLTGEQAEGAVRTLAQLAIVTRGASDTREEASATAIRTALLVRAHRLIEQDLRRPDLSPARVAARLGVSVRKLHLVFEPSGVSFSRYVLARRLEWADGLLRERPRITVTQAALAAGFESLSTFFRSYRAVYGKSPGERQAEAQSMKSGLSAMVDCPTRQS